MRAAVRPLRVLTVTASTRRSYLFYGVPGAGKTSFIQAIAGHCSRSISYLQIDPEMTDVILRSAMEVHILIRPHSHPTASACPNPHRLPLTQNTSDGPPHPRPPTPHMPLSACGMEDGRGRDAVFRLRDSCGL